MTALTPHPVVVSTERLRLTITGAVQGVGFRPFVYRIATHLALRGWVTNTAQGVSIEVEGDRTTLNTFIEQIKHQAPPHADIRHMGVEWLPVAGLAPFAIRPSTVTSHLSPTALILPDLATCPECLREIKDPTQRRYGYPFTNCTHCGPRFSILNALPYDRPATTMAAFNLCAACGAEYDDPGDRRFHAQPIACPHCGPHMELWDAVGALLLKAVAPSQTAAVLQQAAQAIQQGQILALKGLGGFHLIVDAGNEAAVQRLRQRKHRPDKPLALMYPSIERIRQDCVLSGQEAKVLNDAAAPIMLLKRRNANDSAIAPSVAPGQSRLGIMLPYTPLHHLLLAELGCPIVATSGNRSGEPICIDEQEAVEHLAGIADLFLVHNRAIATPIDDSIVQISGDRLQILRRARGYAPLPVQHSIWTHRFPPSDPQPLSVLAVGGHFKSAIALSHGDQIVLSQYLGDLDTVSSGERFHQTIAHFQALYNVNPGVIACDAHPDYHSTRFAQALAQQWQIPLIPVQHHYAHILSVMVEHGLSHPLLGLAWDGTGYGTDGTIWGGESLSITETGFERIAHLKPFPLPGGDAAAREPRRAAMGLLFACFGRSAFDMTHLAPLRAFSQQERRTLQSMITTGINTPQTSSMGRLFDAIASLLDGCQRSSFEGQAALYLEGAITEGAEQTVYPLPLSPESGDSSPLQIDWRPMVTRIIEDIEQSVPAAIISARFHHTLVHLIVQLAAHYYTESRYPQSIQPVVLSGGCFQNQYLLSHAVRALREEGFTPFWSQHIPSNDGGLAAGQVLAAWRVIQPLRS